MERTPFEPKSLVPTGSDQEALHTAFEDAAAGGVTVLEAPPSLMLTEGLATAFARIGRKPFWLRLGPEDRDPATFLISLTAAAQRAHGDIGRTTLELMRARPGPAFGWSPLFAALARELRGVIAQGGAMVLENAHDASHGCPTLSLAGAHLIPELEAAAPCVILADRLPGIVTTWNCVRRSATELRLPAAAVRRMLGEFDPALTRRAEQRAVELVAGRAGLLAGLRAAHAATGGRLEPVLDKAATWEDLLPRLARVLLADTGGEGRCALALAARVEYGDEDGMPALVAGSALPAGPWLQHLDGGWTRVRPGWREPLRAAIGPRAAPTRDMMHDAAAWLLQAGAGHQAIALYIEMGDRECAARAIAGHATALMDLGQWATLDRWLRQLPDDTLASYPGLMSCKADIAASRGHNATAQRWFDMAASLYAKRDDVEAACRNLLAASVIAAERGDLAAAVGHAHTAGSLAEGLDLTAIRLWASWQQGRLQLVSGDADAALVSFCRAAEDARIAEEGAAAQPVQASGQLAAQIRELRREQESHRAAQATLRQAEHNALNQLLASVTAPGRGSDDAVAAYGWSRAPAPSKMPFLGTPSVPAPAGRARPFSRFRRAIMSGRRTDSQRGTALAQAGVDPFAPACRAPRPGASQVPTPAAAQVPPPAAAQVPPPAEAANVSAPLPPPAGKRARDPLVPSVAAGRRDGPAELAVHLLGPLCVAVNDVPVRDWPSPRCRSLFGYLLTHREPWPPREVLMEIFWPGSPPEASRNSLNVAMHALRQTLRTATVLPVILYRGGAYRIHPDLRLWLDVEEFERRVDEGRRLEDKGELEQAAREYEFVATLYRGDFLADDPYEDWAALTRERLRLAHLEALSQLSRLHFNSGRYAACVTLCQRIIEGDPCREDAHRRLMRCYSRQGQPHLALMQYGLCARALTDELGIDTDPATVGLRDQIRRHEPV